MKKEEKYQNIIKTLSNKSKLKQEVYNNTKNAFELLNTVLAEITTKGNADIGKDNERIHLKYTKNGTFDIQLKVAGDLLVFNMHSNIFQFDRNHEIWKSKYVANNVEAGYSGVITVYNFLADSFKYSRMEDLGYLIARIFINKDNHFFVQGKRQTGFGYSTMGTKEVNKNSIEQIVYAAVQYCLDFDLLVPPYDNVKLAAVGQIHQSISDSKLKTGKRLGYQFRSDDID
ncbi:MAG: hypothetical protein KAH17_03780 [Bacteroidales bacterium]|nr:hypothetical protein [Bacteroidales bacterium]